MTNSPLTRVMIATMALVLMAAPFAHAVVPPVSQLIVTCPTVNITQVAGQAPTVQMCGLSWGSCSGASYTLSLGGTLPSGATVAFNLAGFVPGSGPLSSTVTVTPSNTFVYLEVTTTSATAPGFTGSLALTATPTTSCTTAPTTPILTLTVYCNPASSTCTSCQPGFYLSGSTCAQCPANTYAPTTGSTSCLPCPSGSTSSPGASFCITSCSTSQHVSTNCQSCPSGSFLLADTSADCPGLAEWAVYSGFSSSAQPPASGFNWNGAAQLYALSPSGLQYPSPPSQLLTTFPVCSSSGITLNSNSAVAGVAMHITQFARTNLVTPTVYSISMWIQSTSGTPQLSWNTDSPGVHAWPASTSPLTCTFGSTQTTCHLFKSDVTLPALTNIATGALVVLTESNIANATGACDNWVIYFNTVAYTSASSGVTCTPIPRSPLPTILWVVAGYPGDGTQSFSGVLGPVAFYTRVLTPNEVYVLSNCQAVPYAPPPSTPSQLCAAADQLCVACPTGCSACSSLTTCTACATGFSLVSGACQPCFSGYIQLVDITNSIRSTHSSVKVQLVGTNFLGVDVCVWETPEAAPGQVCTTTTSSNTDIHGVLGPLTLTSAQPTNFFSSAPVVADGVIHMTVYASSSTCSAFRISNATDPTFGGNGYGCNFAQTECVLCSWKNPSLGVNCVGCNQPSGSATFNGVCITCLPGYGSATGSNIYNQVLSPCTACAPGKYGNSNTPDTNVCEPCDIGTYQPNSGSANCLACPTGYTTSTTGLTSCDICASGYYGSSCLPCTCVHGTCADGLTGTGACTCTTGFASTNCDQCATNYYNYPTCTFCDPTSTCSGQGTCLSNGTCSCNAGYALNSAGGCDPCQPGTYSNQGDNVCTGCSAGYYAAASGAYSCDQCPAGTFQANPDSTSCNQCPANTYSTGGATSCTSCPSNSGSPAGSSICTCNTGYYQDNVLGGCQPCSTNPGCLTCETYSGINGNAIQCDSCAVNYYMISGSRAIGSTCQPCPANSESAGGTVSVCTCNTGFTSSFDSMGGLVCTATCNPSTTCNGHGTCNTDGSCSCTSPYTGTACNACLSGYYGSSCSPCNCVNGACADGITGTGTCTCTSSAFAGAACDQCAPGYYGSTCQPCACVNGACADGISGTGACSCTTGFAGTLCDQCAPGYYGSSCSPCNCVHGTCNDGIAGTGTCTCDATFGGAACDQCATNYYNYPTCTYCLASTTCSGHGTCSSGGSCSCTTGYTGVDCGSCATNYYNYPVCTFCDATTTCSNHGTCQSDGSCQCTQGYTGANCNNCATNYYNYPTCTFCDAATTCSGYGTCNSLGSCVCTTGYTGIACGQCDVNYYNYPTCTFCTAVATCSGHGTCNSVGSCVCTTGYTGANCGQCAANYYDYPSCTFCNAATTCSGHGTCNIAGSCTCNTGWAEPNCATCASRYGLQNGNPAGSCVACSSTGCTNCVSNSLICNACDTANNYYWVPNSACCASHCVYCLASTTCSNQGTCNTDGSCTCNPGYGGPSCTPCPAGTSWSNGVCSPCAAGTYQTQQAQTSCIACPIGYDQSQQGQTSCVSCATGSYTNQLQQTSCASCAVGTYQNQVAQSSCTNCGVGSYQNQVAQSSCTNCGVGSYQNQVAQSSCTSCAAGSYQNQMGQSACTLCSPNTYSATTGSTSCSNCPAGLYSDAGSSVCVHCAPGSVQVIAGVSGNIECKPCVPGSYSAHAGSTSCTLCTGNTYSSQPFSTSCAFCPQGGSVKKGPHNGIISCDCPAREYVSNGVCTACPDPKTIPKGQPNPCAANSANAIEESASTSSSFTPSAGNMIAVLSIPVSLIVLVCGIFYIRRLRKRRNNSNNENQMSKETTDSTDVDLVVHPASTADI